MDVAIIGAGVAGLVAGRALVERGHAVRVFDKGRAPGGRISTRHTNSGQLRFDHGAQYFTARSDAFRKQTEMWIRRAVAQPWDGRIGVAKRGIVEPKNDVHQRFVGTPQMSALAGDLAAGLDVQVGVRIEGLAQNNHGRWRPQISSGDELGEYDAVLVATPAKQAQPLVQSAERLATTCERAHLAPCWAVMVQFHDDLTLQYDGIFINEGPLSWVARNSSKPGRGDVETWVLHASADWTQKHLDQAPETVAAALIDALIEATSIGPQRTRYVRAHRWMYAIPDPPLEIGALVDPDARLALAGDWLAGARVEGAFTSGLTAAAQLHAVLA